MRPCGPMMPCVFAVAVLLAIASTEGMAAEYKIPVYPQETESERELRETPGMKLGPRSAEWLPRFLEMLKANRPPRFRLVKVALFDGVTGGPYLAVIWRGETLQTPRIEFHRLVAAGEGGARIKYLRALADRDVDLVRPSGSEIFAGEPPVAIVHLGSGGSGLEGYRLRLIQMKRNTVDITPDWAGRVVEVADLDGDGEFETIAIDPQWAGYFDGRGAAGPHLPVVLARVNGAFVPACRTHAGIYRDRIGADLAYGRHPENPSPFRAEAIADALLAAAQIGAFAEARKMLAELGAFFAGDQPLLSLPEARLVLNDYAKAIDQAEQVSDSQCPASAISGGGGHFGTGRRNQYFRFSKD